MFTLNTLAAMVQKAGCEILKREIVDIQQLRFGDQCDPKYKQIRIVGRKCLHAVNVAWPDPLQELASLLQAQLAREQHLLTRSRKKKEKTKSREKSKADNLEKRS
jgi:hypothetical protein